MKHNFGSLSFSHRKLKHEKREDENFAGLIHGYDLLNLQVGKTISNIAVKELGFKRSN
jgi:hypothetical protein